MKSGGTIAAQDCVICSTTAGYVDPLPTTYVATNWAFNDPAGTWFRLGMALQPGTTAADEMLVLVGAMR